MATVTEKDRYNLPVLEFMLQLLREEFPELAINEGSAIYDTLIRPAALILQPQRDYTRVLGRNMYLRNYAVMDDAEMDALAANFLVSRRKGSKARGIQRVFFKEPQSVNVNASVRFFDESGRIFFPALTFSATLPEVQSKVDAATGEYYVDIPVLAELAGAAPVGADAVRNVQGIQGATRTTNPAAFTSGKNSDSNTELYARIRESVTNRDLVKKSGISAAIKEAFPTVRRVDVVGFGDAAMSRDVITAVVSLDSLFSRSFAQKLNVPLDETGNVKWYDEDGTTIVTSPPGGWAGAVIDKMALDFLALRVTQDGRVFRQVAVQSGFSVRMFGENTADPDLKDYRVRAVVDAPATPGGANVRMVLLNEPFSNVSTTGESKDRFPYTILGPVDYDSFHIGGKVDVYVDSTSDEERAVIIGSLDVDNASGDVEIPLTTAAQDAAGNSIFENQVGFKGPVISIVAVEELEAGADTVIRTLAAGDNYAIVRKEKRSRFSTADSDTLILKGDPSTVSTTLEGARIRIRYTTNPDYSAIQSFVNSPAVRDITKDIKVLPPTVLQVELKFDYRGTPDVARVTEVISEFIGDLGFGATVTVNEIVSLLSFYGVTDVILPMTLTARVDNGDGTVTVTQSADRITAGQAQVLAAAGSMSIRRIG